MLTQSAPQCRWGLERTWEKGRNSKWGEPLSARPESWETAWARDPQCTARDGAPASF